VSPVEPPAVDGVTAPQALQHVAAAIALQVIDAGIADDPVAVARTVDVLDVGEEVVAGTPGDVGQGGQVPAQGSRRGGGDLAGVGGREAEGCCRCLVVDAGQGCQGAQDVGGSR
jgi:hypothetical protein